MPPTKASSSVSAGWNWLQNGCLRWEFLDFSKQDSIECEGRGHARSGTLVGTQDSRHPVDFLFDLGVGRQ